MIDWQTFFTLTICAAAGAFIAYWISRSGRV